MVMDLVQKHNAEISSLIADMREKDIVFVATMDEVRVETTAGSVLVSDPIMKHALAMKSIGVTAVYRDTTLGGYRVIVASGIGDGKLEYGQKGVFVPQTNNALAGAERIEFDWRDGSRIKLTRIWTDWYEFVYQSNAP